LFATLAGRSISVASKGLKEIVGSESVDGNSRSPRKMMTPTPIHVGSISKEKTYEICIL
jgi:hypothetical protein